MTKRIKSTRKAAWGVVLLLGALAALPGGVSAASRTTKAKTSSTVAPGAITLTSLQPMDAIRGKTVPIEWTWRSGSLVGSTSRVDVQVSTNGSSWRTIMTGIPIRNGAATWDTTSATDFAYSVRVVVASTSIYSARGPVYVDNTAPEIHILRPSEADIRVDDQDAPRVHFAPVIGTATLEAAAYDNMSGIGKVEWFLDGTKIATGNPVKYNFSAVPGRHDLKATATDRAGNSTSSEIVILAAPGATAADAPSPAPAPTAPGAPSGPCPLPALPAAPPANPCPLPSSVPNPGTQPPAVPDPGSLGQAPDPGTVQPPAAPQQPTAPSDPASEVQKLLNG